MSHVDLTSLDERLRIREAIESGKIQEAISLINTKAPELLDQNRQLAFHLKVNFSNRTFCQLDLHSELKFVKNIPPFAKSNLYETKSYITFVCLHYSESKFRSVWR